MNDKDNSQVYELIAKLCKEKGTSPTALCTEITGSKGNLRTWQKGSINLVSLIKIADYFDVSTDYLLGRTENPHFYAENYIARDNSIQNNVKSSTVNVNTPKEKTREERNVVDVIKYKEVKYPFYRHTKCPFCNADIIEKPGLTYNTTEISFYECEQIFDTFTGAPVPSSTLGEPGYTPEKPKNKPDSIFIVMLRCPYCQKISSCAYDVKHKKKVNIYPNSNARQFPKTVPEDIMSDYTEACDILELSPKASATLSRRCLQKMIRNRWDIELKRLVDEIDTIPNYNISDVERNALHAIREIGNIGAHPDKILEVTLEDAEMTIKVIELFLQKWYIDEPKEKETLIALTEIKKRKKEEKKESKTT